MGRHHLLYEVRRSPFEELAQNGHSLEHAAQRSAEFLCYS
jgi:hypothetical protein